MIITKTIIINITASNINHFRNNGYSPTIRKSLEINVNDLPKGSLEKIEIKCDKCNKILFKCVRNIFYTRNKFGGDFCKSCISLLTLSKKPQCHSEYWLDPKIKEKHSLSVKNSEKYKEARKHIDVSGEKNGMFGKNHSDDTKKTMSIARIGKKQSKATIEKRIKSLRNLYKNREIKGLCKTIKGFLHSNLKWYKRIYERDGFRCVECGGNKPRIDAHHIIPLNKIVKDLVSNKIFLSNREKYEWLIQQPQIIDLDLTNGMTLCRICHKLKHKNWGSHNIK